MAQTASGAATDSRMYLLVCVKNNFEKVLFYSIFTGM